MKTDVAPFFVDVRGRRTQVLRKGEGPPLVYLHSALGETWWTEADEALSERFDMVHPAHPGFDASEGLADIDDIHDLAFHTLDLLDVLGIDRVSLCGTSMGGWLAAELALYAPHRVESIVLCDAVGLSAPALDMWKEQPKVLVSTLFADSEHWLAGLMSAIDLSEPNAPELLLPIIQSLEASARVGWNPYMTDPKLAGRLHRVKARTLVVWGDRDTFVQIDQGRRYAELIAGARLEVIKNCGHLPCLERPAELASLVAEFLLGHR